MTSFYGSENLRWNDPRPSFERLRREMESLIGAPEFALRTPNVFPLVNLYDTTDSLVLMAEVPGVQREDLDVSVQGQQVVLRGQRSITYPEGASAHRRERQAGAFHRAVELPFVVDAEKVEATYRQGVLLLRLPKPDEQLRGQIRVRAA